MSQLTMTRLACRRLAFRRFGAARRSTSSFATAGSEGPTRKPKLLGDERESFRDEDDGPEFPQFFEEAADPVFATPILSQDQVADAMWEAVHDRATKHFKSFYSSVLGGITNEPALMTLPMDDHMVHRGHGVFDTATVVDGQVWLLEEHMARLRRSAERARIPLPFDVARMRRILLDTAATSCCLNGGLRFWLSAGRGGYSLSGHDTLGPEFYAVFTDGPTLSEDETVGWTVITSPVPNKSGIFAEIKSTNYLQNALNVMAARDAGARHGVFLHEDGTVCEGPNLNIGIVTTDGLVRIPPFKECLAGCTMQRLMELIPLYMKTGEAEGIRGWEQGPITMADVEAAAEVFMTASGTPLMAVTHWDGNKVADGTVGVFSLALRQMLLNDMQPREGSGVHTVVPYGMLTGMEEDM